MGIRLVYTTNECSTSIYNKSSFSRKLLNWGCFGWITKNAMAGTEEAAKKSFVVVSVQKHRRVGSDRDLFWTDVLMKGRRRRRLVDGVWQIVEGFLWRASVAVTCYCFCATAICYGNLGGKSWRNKLRTRHNFSKMLNVKRFANGGSAGCGCRLGFA